MGIKYKKTAFDCAWLASVLNTEYCVNNEISAITTDSRECEDGALFIAIKGERFDGHDFIAQAIENGAAAVIADHVPEGLVPEKAKLILKVDDTITALGRISEAFKARISPKTVAVTGSVGKTTTKEFVYAVSSAAYMAHKTAGNFNNEIGLPLSILDMPENAQVCVLEMGMSNLGEISHMTHIAKPDIALITNIGNSHIENLGSRENICKAKLEIVEGVPENGWVILNADEPMLFAQKGLLKQNILFVSMSNPQADYRALNIRENEGCTEFDLVAGRRVVTNVKIPTVGKHNVMDATFAFVVGTLLGMDDDEIKTGLMNFKNTGMRQNIYDYGNVKIIEDCYNAGPESMKAAVEVLARMGERCGLNTVAVLGDMRELGEYSKQLHMEVGELVGCRKISHLVSFGEEAANISLGAINNGMSAHNVSVVTDTEAVENAARAVRNATSGGGIVLFKASRAIRLERVIEALKAVMDADSK